MRSKLTFAGVAAVIACCLLPIKAGGCGGQTACITVSPDDFAKTGRCPSTTEMGTFFVDACGISADIQSVDGEGTYDGALCCYPVTKFGSGVRSVMSCTGDAATTIVGVGVGGDSGGGTCASCADFVAQPGVPPTSVCTFDDFAPTPLSDLTLCACEACAACELNLCKVAAPTAECLACIEGACPNELNICANEI